MLHTHIMYRDSVYMYICMYMYIYIYIYTHKYIYTVKNKVRMRFWLRVMVARLAPPHGSRILTEETPVNMQKHS